ncbi:MAG: beta-hydroxyacyl-ACP dehydratase [Thermodesulfobacteriota bacterium]
MRANERMRPTAPFSPDMVRRLLAGIPQQPPFRFVDTIDAADEAHIWGSYRFREDEWFYPGHFPGNPITPGVILLETMAQIGLVALAVYHHISAGRTDEEMARLSTLFTFAEEVAFLGIVRPGERVRVLGEKVFFRKQGVRARVEMIRESGECVCRGLLSGTGGFAQ